MASEHSEQMEQAQPLVDSPDGGAAKNSSKHKAKHFFSSLLGGLTGLLTFWLYIPGVLQDTFKSRALRHYGILKTAAVVLFPITLLVATFRALILVPYLNGRDGLAAAWKIYRETSLKNKRMWLHAWYTMPLHFLGGLLGLVLGPVLTILFYPLMSVVNTANLGLYYLQSQDVYYKFEHKLRGILFVFCAPFLLIVSLIAAPFRGLYYGKDGLGRVLQSFHGLKVQSVERIEDTDRLAIEGRSVILSGLSVGVFAALNVPLILALFPGSMVAHGILSALTAVGFAASSATWATLLTAGLMSGGFAMVAFLALFAVAQGLMSLSKVIGLGGEKLTHTIYHGAAKAVGYEQCLGRSADPMTLKQRLNAAAHVRDEQITSQEGSFDQVVLKSLSCGSDPGRSLCSVFSC